MKHSNQDNWLSRTELLFGEDNLEKLKNSHVLIAGLGGVGAYAAEQLCRAGIGEMTIVDHDKFSATNRNRQLPALCSTEGKYKVEVMSQRLLDTNPKLKLNSYKTYLIDQPMRDVLQAHQYHYLVDAIDTLSPKVFLIYHALHYNIPVISSMGAGGRMNPLEIKVSDISESSGCRLAYYIRKKLHVLGVYKGVDVVYSPEKVNKDAVLVTDHEKNKKTTVGSISYMTAIFGCYCAWWVIDRILQEKD